MKLSSKVLLVLTLFLIPFIVNAEEKIDIYLFYSETCLHCQAEREFLKELNNDDIIIHTYESINNKENAKLMEEVKNKLSVDSKYVPFTVIGSKAFIGFSDTIESLITDTINEYNDEQRRDIVGELLGTKPVREDIKIDGLVSITDNLKLPILGNVDPKKVSIPILAIVIGFVDGFNPCAMWVLIFLITMLLGMKNKKRMWTLGVTFLVASALVYLLFMLAWLKITIELSSIFIVRLLIALVALVGGAINIKNFIKTKEDGCNVTSKEKRQKIFSKIKKFTSEKSFILAILGVIALAFSVNLIELACSAGLPLIFTQILAINNITGISALLYSLLYILFFLLDDLIVFTIAMVTLNVTGISTKYTKYSHLIGGIIMTVIGLLLIFNPSILMFNFN